MNPVPVVEPLCIAKHPYVTTDESEEVAADETSKGKSENSKILSHLKLFYLSLKFHQSSSQTPSIPHVVHETPRRRRAVC